MRGGAAPLECRHMRETELVEIAKAAAESVISPPLKVERGRALLYELTLNNRLELAIGPDRVKTPRRGQGAFETDLCVVEEVAEGIELPRVVLEFKVGLSTHDVITYSSKAERHKRIYPYLRYGMIVGAEAKVPGKFHTHNEGMDFCFAAGGYLSDPNRLRATLTRLIDQEIAASRRLEEAIFERRPIALFRLEVVTQD